MGIKSPHPQFSDHIHTRIEIYVTAVMHILFSCLSVDGFPHILTSNHIIVHAQENDVNQKDR
jgi:hypothetical protein